MAERRTGAVRMADIPPDVLRALNEGREETITLVEWLAIDVVTLMRHAMRDVGLDDPALLEAARAAAGEKIMQRQRTIARALHAALGTRADRDAVFQRLAGHPSDTVRSWAALVVGAEDHSLADRLERARPFAADPNMGVREVAWYAFRPHLALELDEGLRLLEPWVRDPDEGIRRCAIEGTRPRGVWTAHLAALKADPGRALPLLEPVRSDPSRYVARAVGNWLNDASKDHPAWTSELCARWLRESPTPETTWIARHGLRTLRKRGEA